MSQAGIEKGEKGLRWAAPQFGEGREGITIKWGAAVQEASKSSSCEEEVLIKLCT